TEIHNLSLHDALPISSTIGDLAKALLEMYKADNEIKIIGTRHGEKLYETLCTREEMIKSVDLPGFYQIPADNRDLNYSRYFSKRSEEHTSELQSRENL